MSLRFIKIPIRVVCTKLQGDTISVIQRVATASTPSIYVEITPNPIRRPGPTSHPQFFSHAIIAIPLHGIYLASQNLRAIAAPRRPYTAAGFLQFIQYDIPRAKRLILLLVYQRYSRSHFPSLIVMRLECSASWERILRCYK